MCTPTFCSSPVASVSFHVLQWGSQYNPNVIARRSDIEDRRSFLAIDYNIPDVLLNRGGDPEHRPTGGRHKWRRYVASVVAGILSIARTGGRHKWRRYVASVASPFMATGRLINSSAFCHQVDRTFLV